MPINELVHDERKTPAKRRFAPKNDCRQYTSLTTLTQQWEWKMKCFTSFEYLFCVFHKFICAYLRNKHKRAIFYVRNAWNLLWLRGYPCHRAIPFLTHTLFWSAINQDSLCHSDTNWKKSYITHKLMWIVRFAGSGKLWIVPFNFTQFFPSPYMVGCLWCVTRALWCVRCLRIHAILECITALLECVVNPNKAISTTSI